MPIINEKSTFVLTIADTIVNTNDGTFIYTVYGDFPDDGDAKDNLCQNPDGNNYDGFTLDVDNVDYASKITDISVLKFPLSRKGSHFQGITCESLQCFDSEQAPYILSGTSFTNIFYDARAFNQDIGSWDTTLVTDMSCAFKNTQAFNQDLNSWNTENVTSMDQMFSVAPLFNGNVQSWNTSNVTNMYELFGGAKAFNQDISLWNTASVGNMQYMFYEAEKFNQDLSGWNVNAVTNSKDFAKGADAWTEPIPPFNQSL